MNGFLSRLAQQDAVLVRVLATQGSAPRETGTRMLVAADAVRVGQGRLGQGRRQGIEVAGQPRLERPQTSKEDLTCQSTVTPFPTISAACYPMFSELPKIVPQPSRIPRNCSDHYRNWIRWR